MSIRYEDPWLTIHVGDCRDVLATLPAESVHCVVTSPPYWGLRDYGVTGQMGLEATPDAYVDAMVCAFREVRRVLRDDGTVWLNLGDSYASQATNSDAGGSFQAERGAYRAGRPDRRGVQTGMKPKDLVGIPWMVAFALRSDGWYLRSDIIWAKTNPMPESVTDRPTKAHEYLFLLSKSSRYFYDADAVAEPLQSSPSDLRKIVEGKKRMGGLVKEQDDPLLAASGRTNVGRKRSVGNKDAAAAALRRSGNIERKYGEDRDRPGSHLGASVPWEDTGKGRNRRSVWTVATQPYPGSHFAVMPEALVEPCILAGCPEGGTVLDPFGGSGTVAVVAQRHRRRAVLIELNPEYADQSVVRASRSWGKGGRVRRGPKPTPDGSWLTEAVS